MMMVELQVSITGATFHCEFFCQFIHFYHFTRSTEDQLIKLDLDSV